MKSVDHSSVRHRLSWPDPKSSVRVYSIGRRSLPLSNRPHLLDLEANRNFPRAVFHHDLFLFDLALLLLPFFLHFIPSALCILSCHFATSAPTRSIHCSICCSIRPRSSRSTTRLWLLVFYPPSQEPAVRPDIQLGGSNISFAKTIPTSHHLSSSPLHPPTFISPITSPWQRLLTSPDQSFNPHTFISPNKSSRSQW